MKALHFIFIVVFVIQTYAFLHLNLPIPNPSFRADNYKIKYINLSSECERPETGLICDD